MAALTLFLTSTATGAPRPTTSRLLSTTANASEVTLGPGEFDNGLPGNSDAGQWNPSSPIANTTAAAELDNTGATAGTTRQGWLYDVDLAGQSVAAGAWSVQLRLAALQGAATETAALIMRVSIVTYAGGAWTTVKQIFTTRVTGATSTTAGQGGWRDQNEAVFGVAAAAANFAKTVGDSGTAQSHTFASGERIFIELGFGNANSTTDRTWQLLYNTSNSFITTPNIAASYTLVAATGARTLTGGATGLTAQRRLTAATGALTETGNAAGLNRGRLLTAATGAIAWTGIAAGLTYAPSSGNTLVAESFAMTLTGQAAGLRAARRLTAALGTLTETGNAAGLLTTRRIVAALGTLVLTGPATGLRAARRIVAAVGTFVETGNAANLRTAGRLQADRGMFAITGPATGILAGRRIVAALGARTLAGGVVNFATGKGLAAATGVLTLTGPATGIRAGRRLAAAVGAHALAGGAVTFPHGYTLTADDGSFTLAGAAAAMLLARRLDALLVALTLTGRPAALNASGGIVLTMYELDADGSGCATGTVTGGGTSGAITSRSTPGSMR